MPLSEPMKAAIVVGIMLAVVGIMLAMAVASAGMAIANAIKAEAIGTYAGFGGLCGGLFEDRLDLD